MFHSLLNRHMSHSTHFLLNTEVIHVSLVHKVWIPSCFVLQWAYRRPQARLCGSNGRLGRQHQQPSGSWQAEWCRLHQCIMLSVRSEWQIQSGYPWWPFSCLILCPLITLDSVWKEPYCFKCGRKKSECMFPPIPVFPILPFEILSCWFIAVFPLSPPILSFPLAEEGQAEGLTRVISHSVSPSRLIRTDGEDLFRQASGGMLTTLFHTEMGKKIGLKICSLVFLA